MLFRVLGTDLSPAEPHVDIVWSGREIAPLRNAGRVYVILRPSQRPPPRFRPIRFAFTTFFNLSDLCHFL